MTAASAANILTIHDMVVRTLGEKLRPRVPVRSNTPLQGQEPQSLGWTDLELQKVLEEVIHPMFRVQIERKQMRATINGSNLTVGDLVIAIFTEIHRLHRPRIRSAQRPDIF